MAGIEWSKLIGVDTGPLTVEKLQAGGASDLPPITAADVLRGFRIFELIWKPSVLDDVRFDINTGRPVMDPKKPDADKFEEVRPDERRGLVLDEQTPQFQGGWENAPGGQEPTIEPNDDEAVND